jgi:hypothetical protein
MKLLIYYDSIINTSVAQCSIIYHNGATISSLDGLNIFQLIGTDHFNTIKTGYGCLTTGPETEKE